MTRSKFLLASLALAAPALLQARSALACYSVAIGKDATADGSVIVGHNEQNDESRYVVFKYVPRAEHGPQEIVSLSRGGQLPQVPVTWGYLWSNIPGQEFSDAYLNEWGVSIVSNWCPSREELDDRSDGGIGYFLRRLVVERAKTAREGVQIAGNLVEQFGYVDTGRTYVVSDARESWVLAVVRGRHWVAQRVPDRQLVVIPNVYVIRGVDLSDSQSFLGASDLVSYAASRGWYDPESGRPFDFCDAYGDPYAVDDRHRQGLAHIAGVDIEQLDGQRLPFSVTPARRVSVKDMVAHLRAFDTVGTTQEGAVFQLRDWLPPEIASIYWRTSGAPSYSPFTPWYAGTLETPSVFFDDDRSAWSAFIDLHRLVDSAGGRATQSVGELWGQLEARVFRDYPAVDQEAQQMLRSDTRAARELLADHSRNVALKAIQLARKMTAGWIADPDLPVALAAAAPTSRTDPLAYSFEGFSLLDGGTTVREYRWDFGDGTTGVGESVQHRYPELGRYVAVLTAVGEFGVLAEDTLVIDPASPDGKADDGRASGGEFGSACSAGSSSGPGSAGFVLLLGAACLIGRGRRRTTRSRKRMTEHRRPLAVLVTLGMLAVACACGSGKQRGEADQPEANTPATEQPAEETTKKRSPETATTNDQESIGQATMKPDGTIVLQLRAETGDIKGDALFEYPPTHENYKEVLDHLGGLEPGQEKPVPPWPE